MSVLRLLGLTVAPALGVWHPLVLETNQGPLEGGWADCPGADRGLLFLGDQPEYSALATRFKAFGLSSLRLTPRDASDAVACGLDAMLGVYLLNEQGIGRVAAVSEAPLDSLGDRPLWVGACDIEPVSEWLKDTLGLTRSRPPLSP